MTTPPSDKQPAAETLEEIAVQTLNRWRGMNVKISRDLYESPAAVAQLCEMITEALRNERERCQKVADKYVADMRSVTKRTEYGEGCLNAGVYIAARIRVGK